MFWLLTTLFPDILGLIKPCKIPDCGAGSLEESPETMMKFFHVSTEDSQKVKPMDFFLILEGGPSLIRTQIAHIAPIFFQICSWNPEVSTSIFEGLFPPKNKVQTPTKTRVIKGFRVLLKKKIEDNNHQPTVTVTGNSGLLADVKAAASGAKAGLDKF